MASDKHVKINADLHEKLKLWRKETNMPANRLVNKLLTDFFKDKVINKEGIPLDIPFVFDANVMQTDVEVTARKNDELLDDGKIIEMLDEIPNNMDEGWNDETGYFFKEHGRHRGVKQYVNVIFDGEIKLNIVYLVFNTLFQDGEIHVKVKRINPSTLKLRKLADADLLEKLEQNHGQITNIFNEFKWKKEREIVGHIVKGNGDYTRDQYEELKDALRMFMQPCNFEGLDNPNLTVIMTNPIHEPGKERRYFMGMPRVKTFEMKKS